MPATQRCCCRTPGSSQFAKAVQSGDPNGPGHLLNQFNLTGTLAKGFIPWDRVTVGPWGTSLNLSKRGGGERRDRVVILCAILKGVGYQIFPLPLPASGTGS